MGEILIVPGHYKPKFDGGTNDIIRIIGAHPTRANYWVADDKKAYSDYELAENWEPMVVGAVMSDLTRKLPNMLFAGLGPLPGHEEEAYDDHVEPAAMQEQEQKPEYSQQKPVYSNNVGMVVQPAFQEQPPQKSPQQIFLEQVFAKLMSSSNGDDYLQVTINLNLGFSIDKLKDTMEMLDLDSLELVGYIVKNLVTINKVNNAISAEINRKLTGPSEPIPVIVAKPEQPIAKPHGPPADKTTVEIGEPIEEIAQPTITAKSDIELPAKEPWEMIEMNEPVKAEEEPASENMSKLLSRVKGPATVDKQVSDLENRTKNLLAGFMDK